MYNQYQYIPYGGFSGLYVKYGLTPINKPLIIPEPKTLEPIERQQFPTEAPPSIELQTLPSSIERVQVPKPIERTEVPKPIERVQVPKPVERVVTFEPEKKAVSVNFLSDKSIMILFSVILCILSVIYGGYLILADKYNKENEQREDYTNQYHFRWTRNSV
jgi:hypothetical protein